MAQRCNAALPQDPLGTVHIPGANAGSYETSTNDSMNIQPQNDDADHPITACDDSEVNVTHARPPQDVAGVSIDNNIDVVRRPGEDYCFQVDSRQVEVAKNAEYAIILKSVTHDAPKFEHHTDDSCHSTAAYDNSEIDATDPRTSPGVAGFGSSYGAANQASKNERDGCSFQVSSRGSEAANTTVAYANNFEPDTSNDTYKLQHHINSCDSIRTTYVESEVDVSNAGTFLDAPEVVSCNKAVDRVSANEVVRTQQDECSFQATIRRSKVAHNTGDFGTIDTASDDSDCSKMVINQGGNESAVDIVYDVTGFDSCDNSADKANTNKMTLRKVKDNGFQVERSHHSEAAHNTTEPLTEDIDLPSCNSCRFVSFYGEGGPLWEEHARHDVTCPTIQKDIDAQFIDIRSRKLEICGENAEHLRLKEWRLCKACSLLQSTIMLMPCQHLCLCQLCAETETCCPTCSCDIIHKIHVKLECEIPNAP